jgi:hypothetical protein
MSEHKKFRSISGVPVRVALTTGHTAIIPATEWKSLHPMFHADAYSRGCISEDQMDNLKDAIADVDKKGMNGDFGEDNKPRIDAPMDISERFQPIVQGCKELIAMNNPDKFTGQGNPRIDALSEICGFEVTSEERTQAWAEASKG